MMDMSEVRADGDDAGEAVCGMEGAGGSIMVMGRLGGKGSGKGRRRRRGRRV